MLRIRYHSYDVVKVIDQSKRQVGSRRLQVELKLIKSEPIHWPTLLSSIAASQPSIPGSSASPRPTQTQPATQSGPSEPSSSSQPQAAPVSDQAALDDIIGIAQPRSAHTGGPGKINAQRKNWDKLVDAELQEKEDSGDPVCPVRRYRPLQRG